MKRPTYQEYRSAGLDAKMTPMIDVIFQLQIFFLCTAGFVLPEGILPTHLPPTGAVAISVAPPPVDLEMVRIRMRGRGADFRLELNERTVQDIEELIPYLQRLASASARLPVILDISSEVLIGRVVEVYDRCLAAGLKNVSFAANRSSRQPTGP